MPTEESHHDSVKAIFIRAIAMEDPQDRHRYVADACGDDHGKRERVDALLVAHDRNCSNILDDAVATFQPGETKLSTETSVDGSAFEVSAPRRIGPYKLREQIGEGGMGTVYVAEQTQPVRRKVALKIIRASMAGKETVARFEAERQALAMMDHPNIAKVLDGGTTSTDQPFFAMELVHGVPITEYADSHRLTTAERLEIFVKICRAVQHAHRKGVIHRDLKPSNILVADIDDCAVPKIIDFGLAKAIDQPLTDGTVYTRFSQMIGTPSYMSPEQAAMGVIDVDTRSDVYSLGVLLYELLVGDPPFDRETFRSASFDEVRRIIREVEPPRPSRAISTLQAEKRSTVADSRRVDTRKLSESMRGELDWLVMKSLEKDRRRRYGSASELADDVQRFLDRQPVLACPPTFSYRFKKLVQRNRLVIFVTTIVLLALVTTSLAATWQVIQVRRAWLESEARERLASDLLEGMRLQSTLTPFRNQNLARLAQAAGDIVPVQASVPAGSVAQPGLGNLMLAAAHPQPLRSFDQQTSVHDVAVSADGQRMVSVDESGSVIQWDLTSTEQGGKVLGSHGEPAHAVAVSPDGTTAVSGSTTGHIWFWDLDSGVCIKKLRPATTGVETLVWSPDGKWVAAGARYSQVWVCDAKGKQSFRIENDHRHEGLLFSPDNEFLMVPTREGIDVWEIAKRKRQRTMATDPLSNVRAICWAGPNHEWLIAGERFSESLLVLDWKTGKKLGVVPVGAEYASSLATSRDGQWLAAGYANGHVQIISLTKSADGSVHGDVQQQFIAHQKTRTPPGQARTTVSWMDRYRFISAGSDGQVRLWDRIRIRPYQQMEPPEPLNLAYLLDDTELVFVFHGTQQQTGDRPIRFDSDDRQKAIVGERLSMDVRAFSKHPAQGLIAIGTEHEVAIVSLHSGKVIRRIESPLRHPVFMSLSRNGAALVASSDKQICVWATSDQWQSHELLRTWDRPTQQIPLVTNSAQTIIVPNEENDTIIELDVHTGQELRRHDIDINEAMSLGNQERFLAVATDFGIRVVDRSTNEICFEVDDLSQPRSLEFSPDDRVLVSGHLNQTVHAWHIPTGQSLGILFKQKQVRGRLEALHFSEDARRLMIWYRDGGHLRPTILGRGHRSTVHTYLDVR